LCLPHLPHQAFLGQTLTEPLLVFSCFFFFGSGGGATGARVGGAAVGDGGPAVRIAAGVCGIGPDLPPPIAAGVCGTGLLVELIAAGVIGLPRAGVLGAPLFPAAVKAGVDGEKAGASTHKCWSLRLERTTCGFM